MIPRIFVMSETADESFAPLSSAEAAKLLLTDFPPARFADLTDRRVGGYCSRYPDMPSQGGGEVVIDVNLASGQMPESSRRKWLRTTYIHEVAHRLVTDESHGPVFAAVNAALVMRTSDEDALGAVRWYDVQDAENPGAALNHAIEFGRLHKASQVPARDLPPLAAASWAQWRDKAWKALMAEATVAANARAKFQVECRDISSNADRIAVVAERARVLELERELLVEKVKSRADRRSAASALAAAVARRAVDWRSIGSIGLAAFILGVVVAMALR